MSIEGIAKRLGKAKTLEEQGLILKSLGWRQSIKPGSGRALKLSMEDPERFIRVGNRVVDKRKHRPIDSDYEKVCIAKAKDLFENNPLVFGFYDELEDSLMFEENLRSR